MRTLRQLAAYFKRHKMKLMDRGDYLFNIGGIRRKDSWSNYSYYEGGTTIGCQISQASFCCGVIEMGGFSSHGAEFKDHWKAIFEYVILKEKLSYLRTTTITDNNPHTAIEEALKEIGFRLVVTIPSSHGKRERKKYDINVWEWLKT